MGERKRKAAPVVSSLPAMQGAYYEKVHLQVLRGRRRQSTMTASELRDAVLKKMGPVADCMYDPEALALLDEFELALREAWERIDAAAIREEADAAIAAALNLPAQFRMLT